MYSLSVKRNLLITYFRLRNYSKTVIMICIYVGEMNVNERHEFPKTALSALHRNTLILGQEFFRNSEKRSVF